MEQVKASFPEKLPSFSMVLETENLVNADINGLSESLKSLVNQELLPQGANEFFIIDSGDVPPEKLVHN